MIIATGVIVKFLFDPSDVMATSFTGIATIIGSVFSISYVGMIVGERNNLKEAELPAIPSPKIP